MKYIINLPDGITKNRNDYSNCKIDIDINKKYSIISHIKENYIENLLKSGKLKMGLSGYMKDDKFELMSCNLIIGDK